MSVEVEQRSEPECPLCGHDLSSHRKGACPFPVSIASLEEHLESVVIVPTSLERATATSPATPPSFQPGTVNHQPHLTKTMVMPAASMHGALTELRCLIGDLSRCAGGRTLSR